MKSSDDDVMVRLLRVVSRRYAVDVLDLLANRPRTFDELRAAVRARPRELDDAIRSLATENAITCPEQPGSWDARAPATTRYELTATGQDMIDRLCQPDAWTTMEEYYRHRRPPEQGAVY